MTINEWEALPWWQQVVYIEGLSEEFYDPDAEPEDIDDDWDSLTSYGANVRRVEAPVE